MRKVELRVIKSKKRQQGERGANRSGEPDGQHLNAGVAPLPDRTEPIYRSEWQWRVSTTETALTAHLVRPGAQIEDDMLHHACEELQKHFGISHATLQIEDGTGAHPCVLQPSDVV